MVTHVPQCLPQGDVPAGRWNAGIGLRGGTRSQQYSHLIQRMESPGRQHGLLACLGLWDSQCCVGHSEEGCGTVWVVQTLKLGNLVIQETLY